jgi:hypothetical protein
MFQQQLFHVHFAQAHWNAIYTPFDPKPKIRGLKGIMGAQVTSAFGN